MDPVDVNAAERARARSGGDDQRPEPDARSVVQPDRPGVEVKQRRPQAEAKLDAQVGVRVRVAQPHELPLAPQNLLGQRRAVVRRLALLPDERDRAGEAALAQPLRGADPGQAGADDDDSVGRGVIGRGHVLTALTWEMNGRLILPWDASPA